MIKLSMIYIGIVVAIAAVITGLPMLVWTDETADQVQQVANLPISTLISSADRPAPTSGFGSAEAGGAESSAPVAPLPNGVEEATAALLEGLSKPPPAPEAQPELEGQVARAPVAAAPAPTPAASAGSADDSLAAAVAAAVASTTAPVAAPVPEPGAAAEATSAAASAPVPVGDDLTALIGATGAAQDELASMSGAALTGLRALRGAAAQGVTLDELVARAAQAGAQDDYIKALQEEANR